MIDLFNPFSAPESYRACVGIDWGQEKNCAHLLADGCDEVERVDLQASPVAMLDFVAGLRERFAAGRILVVSEQSKGALVNLLLDFEFIDLLAVNPHAAAKFRRSLHPAGSKSDPIDSDALLRMIFTHRKHMARVRRGDEASRRLDGLNRHRRALVGQRVEVALRVQSLLHQYYPQALDMLGAEVWDPISCAFLRRWPSYSRLAKAREQTLRQFFYAQGSRSAPAIERRLYSWRISAALSSDTLLEELGEIQLSDYLDQMRVLNKQIQKLDVRVKRAYAEHPDQPIFSSFPAAGPAMAPRLAAAFGSDRDRFASCSCMQAYVGIAPIKISSGKNYERTFMRRFCPTFLKQSFHEWAGLTIGYSPWAKACYRMLLARGKGRASAKRTLAFKWMRIMYRCWEERTTYDERAYVQALIKRGSPIVEWMKQLGFIDEKNTILFA